MKENLYLLTHEQEARIIQMWEQTDLTRAGIASEIGLSYNTFTLYCERAGLFLREKREAYKAPRPAVAEDEPDSLPTKTKTPPLR